MAGERLGTIHHESTKQTLTEALAQAVSALQTASADDHRMVSVQANIAVRKQWLLSRMTTSGRLACTALWLPAVSNQLIAGFGKAACVSIKRGQALTELSQQFQSRLASWTTTQCTVRPKWFGGFAFRPDGAGKPWLNWPGAKLELPTFQLELSLGTKDGVMAFSDAPDILEGVITYSATLPSTSDSVGLDGQFEHDWSLMWDAAVDFSTSETPSVKASDTMSELSEAAWSRAVAASANAIRTHQLRKVVLARLKACPVPAQGRSVWLRNLLRADPSATAFVIANDADAFIGASPERLVRVLRGAVAVDCLAGSRPRGADEGADEALGQMLLASQKDQAEHRVVVDWVTSKLDSLTHTLTVPSEPTLKKMATVQHLHTPVQGELFDGVDVLDVAAALHPTPAVAGDPVELALSAIASHEPVDRGWYAGSVGWVDAEGDGEFVVALRSALVQGQYAILYAGAGIMADSDAAQEWQETNWKLRPMRRVMACSDEEMNGDG